MQLDEKLGVAKRNIEAGESIFIQIESDGTLVSDDILFDDGVTLGIDEDGRLAIFSENLSC